jgi:hypothetical protein
MREGGKKETAVGITVASQKGVFYPLPVVLVTTKL